MDNNTQTQSETDSMQLLTGLEKTIRAGRFGAEADSPLQFEAVIPGSIVQLAAWSDTTEQFASAVNTACSLELPEVGGSTSNNEATLLWVGPDRYLYVGLAESAYKKFAEQIKSDIGSVLEMSSSRCVIRITGANAITLLQKGVPVDLSEAKCAAGSVASSSIDAHVNALLHKRTSDSFDIYVPRGYAVSLWEWLSEAALEFGFEVKG